MSNYRFFEGRRKKWLQLKSVDFSYYGNYLINSTLQLGQINYIFCAVINVISFRYFISAYGSILTYVYTLYFEIHWRIRQSFPGLDRVEFPFSPYPSSTDISGGLRIIPHLKEEMEANSIPPPATHYCIKYQQWGKPHNSLLGIIITYNKPQSSYHGNWSFNSSLDWFGVTFLRLD